MQIHELDNYVGTLDENTYLAVDDGTETTKLSANNILPVAMTVAEAEEGLVTATRVVAPDVFNEAVNSLAGTKASEIKVLVLSESISSLPATVTNSDITDDMVCIKAELGTPSVQTSDWTVTTDNGSLSITGSKGTGSTTIKLYLAKSR